MNTNEVNTLSTPYGKRAVKTRKTKKMSLTLVTVLSKTLARLRATSHTSWDKNGPTVARGICQSQGDAALAVGTSSCDAR